jgi:hypothetical protein
VCPLGIFVKSWGQRGSYRARATVQQWGLCPRAAYKAGWDWCGPGSAGPSVRPQGGEDYWGLGEGARTGNSALSPMDTMGSGGVGASPLCRSGMPRGQYRPLFGVMGGRAGHWGEQAGASVQVHGARPVFLRTGSGPRRDRCGGYSGDFGIRERGGVGSWVRVAREVRTTSGACGGLVRGWLRWKGRVAFLMPLLGNERQWLRPEGGGALNSAATGKTARTRRAGRWLV